MRKFIITVLAAGMVLSMSGCGSTDVLCGCAFCILTTVQTDGVDSCP